jgi:hypothetical protein
MLRSERMLNIEKYKEVLVVEDIISPDKLALVQGQPHICKCGIMCDECLFDNHNFSCSNDALNWLFTEYKEEKEELEVDWSKVKVDTPILVKDILKSEWIKRYFAKYENGRVYVWKEGKTSWSAVNEHDVNSWKYAKLAEREE